jgi:hypothetical protein
MDEVILAEVEDIGVIDLIGVGGMVGSGTGSEVGLEVAFGPHDEKPKSAQAVAVVKPRAIIC